MYSGFSYVCKFIEHTSVAARVLHLLGKEGLTSRYRPTIRLFWTMPPFVQLAWPLSPSSELHALTAKAMNNAVPKVVLKNHRDFWCSVFGESSAPPSEATSWRPRNGK